MSFLNFYINQLFGYLKESEVKNKVYWIDETNLIVDSEKLALECIRQKDDTIDYEESVKEFSSFLNEFNKDFGSLETHLIYLHHFIASDNDFNRIKRYLTRLSVATRNSEVILYSLCVELCVSFERHLRQLLFNLVGCDKHLLKDLIADEALLKVFNKHDVSLIKLLIGSSRSINLRNLIWHGFFNLDDSLNAVLVKFFLIMINKLGWSLQSYEIKQRKNTIPFQFEDFFIKSNLESGIFLIESLINNSKQILDLFKSSDLIPNDRLKIFEYSISEECDAFESLILVLPQLEFVLRKVYVIANEYKGEEASKILCAQHEEYYSTLDDLLAENCHNDAVNKLRQAIGDKVILIFYDVFMYEAGLRLRDRVSHGDWSQLAEDCNVDISTKLVKTCFYLILCLVNKENEEILKINEDYLCQYHPLNRIRLKLLEFAEKFLPLGDHIGELEEICCEIGLDKSNLKQSIISYLKDYAQRDQEKLVYLYSGNSNSVKLQLIGLIQRQIIELEAFNKRLIAYEKEMDKRERENRMHTRNLASLQKFCSCKNTFIELIYSSVLTSIKQLSSTSVNIKSMKKLVTLCENVRRESEMNRWYECYNLIEKFKNKNK